MAVAEAPILSRLDRLDNVMRQLEEIRCGNRSPKSSCASSGTLTSDGRVSSVDFSPKSLEKHCRPMEHVMMETESKGTLVERLDHIEDRVIKLCMQLEEEIEGEKKREERTNEKKNHKKGLKQLIKQVVRGSRKTKTKQ